MDPRFAYILDYFRRIYRVPAEVEIGYGTRDRRINIHAGCGRFFEGNAPYPAENVIWKNWRETDIPLLFSGDPEQQLLTLDVGRAFIHHDLLAGAFYFLSGWQERVFMRRHTALRYPYRDSLQARLKFTHLPVVNYYFDVLKQAVEKVYGISLSLPAWGGQPGALCLTHDIDKCRSGWRYDLFHRLKQGNLAAAGRIVAQKIGGRDSWFNLEEILDLEARYGAKSSFYFIAQKGNVFFHPGRETVDRAIDAPLPSRQTAPDYFFRRSPAAMLQGYREKLENADYDIRTPQMRQIFREIHARGGEVGIHGGFGSHLSTAQFAEEMARFGVPVAGGRFHYLNFDITSGFDLLAGQGLRYDSTLGFAEAPGFRNGIAFPFAPYDFARNHPYPLLEIPLMAMDTTFRSYQHTPLPEILPAVSALLEETIKFNGCLTVLWHNAYFSPHKFAGWREIYEGILQEGCRRNLLLTSGEEVCRRWQGVLKV